MEKRKLRSFERSLPMSLLRAREAVMKKFVPTLKEHNLTPQQWRVIRALEAQDGLNLSELSDRCYLLMPSLSRIIQNLETRRIVRRESEVSDQRFSVIYLMDEGKRLYKVIAPKSIERYDHIAEKFGPGKLDLLYSLLDELVEKLE